MRRSTSLTILCAALLVALSAANAAAQAQHPNIVLILADDLGYETIACNGGESYRPFTPEVESYSRRTGLQLGLSITEPNTGDFLVKLKAGHARPTDGVTGELRTEIESSEPALRVEFVGILTDLIGDLTSSPAPIQIRMFSEDTNALHNAAAFALGALTYKINHACNSMLARASDSTRPPRASASSQESPSA